MDCLSTRPSKPMVGGSSPSRRATREESFWAAVDQSGGPSACWPWTKYRTPAGYGALQAGSRRDGTRRPIQAHRYAFLLCGGVLADGQEVRHLCGNRPCCNPAHLAAGSHQENIADTVAMGRTTAGERHPLHKLTARDVVEIRRRRAAGEPARAIAADLGIDPSRVYQIAKGEGWAHVEVQP